MFEAVDQCLQELMQDPRPFGGKAVLLGGDFRQIPPVLRYIDRDAVASHTLVALPWWRDGRVKRFELTRNMRAKDGPCAGRVVHAIILFGEVCSWRPGAPPVLAANERLANR